MSKYDIHKWKDGELNERLMEKWGYKKKVLKEDKMPMKRIYNFMLPFKILLNMKHNSKGQ